MGSTFPSSFLRACTWILVLFRFALPAWAADFEPGQTLWVKAGASIELEGTDKQLYDAPAGASLVVQKVSRVKGKNGTFEVATVQDTAGTVYRTLAANLRGKVTVEAMKSALEMPANAAAAAQVLSGQQPACAPGTSVGDGKVLGPAVSVDAPVANAEQLARTESVNSKDCISTLKHKACTQTPCNLTPPPDSAMKRFYPLIVEALNSGEVSTINARARARGIAEIHPAMIASIIAAESSGRPLVTFTEKSGRLGKGIGQYTYFEKAWSANLDYNAKMPTDATVFGSKVNTPYSLTHGKKTKQVYSVWSPKGVILGMAADMTDILGEDRYITPRGATGAPIPGAAPIEVSHIYKKSPTQAMRYLAGHHNRQDRVFQSIEEFHRQKGRLPSEYGETWGVAPKKGTSKALLYGQCINRCYVEKIAGLCGKAEGYFARYQKHFARGADGKWSVAG